MTIQDQAAQRTSHTGSCLCGGVRYTVRGQLPAFEVCHCSQCRKAQGGPFVVVAPVAASMFRLVEGETLLESFSASPGKERMFCRRCGSPLFSRRTSAPDRIRLRVGTLDDASGARIASHAHVASKAEWWTIDDDGPQYPGARPTGDGSGPG